MTRAWVRRRPGPGQAFLAALGAALVVLGIVGPVGAVKVGKAWTVTPSTVAVPEKTPTDVRLTISNVSGPAIGCVTVQIATSKGSVSAVSVVSVTRGLSWSATTSTSPTAVVVTAAAATSADRLIGIPDLDQLVLKLTVTGKVVGAWPWTASAFQNLGCTSNASSLVIPMTIVGLPTLPPTPEPTDTPTPAPTPTRTPAPTTSPTPTDTPTPTPILTLPPLPSPGLTPTPSPSARPGGTPIPPPAPTPTQGPTVAPGGPGGGGSPGSGGAGGAGGTGGPGPSPGPSRRPLEVPAADPGPSRPFDTGGVPGFEAFDWAVPGVILTGPGLLLIVLILAQAAGALAWLPVVRRKIGSFGLRRRRRSHHAT
jgi:hypothetical protein